MQLPHFACPGLPLGHLCPPPPPRFHSTVKEGFVSDPHFFLSFNLLIKLISEINSKGWLEEFYLFYQHIYKNKLSSYNGNQQLLAWILTV